MRRTVTAILVAAFIGATGSHALAVGLAIVNNMGGTYMDISSTGMALNLTDDGQTTIVTPFVNGVFTSNVVTISNNMALGFGPAAAGGIAPPTNTTLPNGTLFNGEQTLAVMWDNPGANTPMANVYYQSFADRYIVQWDMLPKGLQGGTVTVQAQIFGGTPRRSEFYAQMFYHDVEQPGVRDIQTIGYQDGGHGFNDVLWSFNSPTSINNTTILTLLIPAPGSVAVAGLMLMAGLRRRR